MVASLATITHSRPETRPMPQIIEAECTSPPYMPQAASCPTSRNGEPGSSRPRTRSRGSSLPRARCFSRAFSSPPIAALSVFSFRSATSPRMRSALARKSAERRSSCERIVGMARALSSSGRLSRHEHEAVLEHDVEELPRGLARLRGGDLPAGHPPAPGFVVHHLVRLDVEIDAVHQPEGRVRGAVGHGLAVERLAEQGERVQGHRTYVRRVAEEGLVPRVGHMHAYPSALRANAPELLHDADERVRRLAEVLEHVVEQDLLRAGIRPGPGKALQVDHLVGLKQRRL